MNFKVLLEKNKEEALENIKEAIELHIRMLA